MHQVHCVGVLWLFAHRNEWDFRTILNRTEDFMKIHARHCNMMLMNMVKCMADVTPVLFQRDVNNPVSGSGLGRWKPIDAPRRCKSFDSLWNCEGQILCTRRHCSSLPKKHIMYYDMTCLQQRDAL